MIPPQTAALILAAARGSAFAATVPLAASGAVPQIVRATLSIALIPALAASQPVEHAYAIESLAFDAVGAACVGAAFGLSASVVAGAAASAGGLIDGALASQVLIADKLSGTNAGSFARLFGLAFAYVFFASGWFTALIARFAAAAANVPAHVFSVYAAQTLGRDCIGTALALAGPAICAQCIATLIAALAARVAPKINAMFLSTPLTAGLVIISLIAGAGALLPTLLRLAERTVAAAGA